VLAFFVWKFSNRAANAEIKTFPGGAKWLVIAALALSAPRCLPGFLGQRAWGYGVLHIVVPSHTTGANDLVLAHLSVK